jgi:hypothetical protein
VVIVVAAGWKIVRHAANEGADELGLAALAQLDRPPVRARTEQTKLGERVQCYYERVHLCDGRFLSDYSIG